MIEHVVGGWVFPNALGWSKAWSGHEENLAVITTHDDTAVPKTAPAGKVAGKAP
jgi:hypothetical protein